MTFFDSCFVLLCFVLSFNLQFSAVAAADLHTHDNTFVPDVILRISAINLAVACTHRQSTVINGTAPGPPVVLTADKTTWVRVYNDQTDANATVHWHGLSQSVAPFSDGTPLASQWPIPPGHYFDYELHPLAKEAGSYFYHSHVEFQTVSAAGPLIVTEPNGQKPPIKYDDERIFFMSELYNKTDTQIIDGLLGAPFVWSGEPEALMVNGHGSAAPNATDKTCGPEVIEVEPSKTYRFRFIGGVALADINLAFEDHDKLTVVAADAGYTKPFDTDHLQAASGQRFDVLFTTKSLADLQVDGKTKTDYSVQLQTMYRPTIVQGNAILRYKTTPNTCCTGLACYVPGASRPAPPPYTDTPKNISSLLPLVGDTTTNTWLEYALAPLVPNNFPAAKDVTRRLYLTNLQVQLADKQIPFEVNNHSWVADPLNSTYASTKDQAPILVDIYKNGQSAVPSLASAQQYYTSQQHENATALETGWDPATNAYPANKGEVLEIILLNLAGFANTYDVHPWHAHGGHYYDIGSGPGMYDADANNAKLDKLQKESGYSPALRDSTLLYRWPADNKVNDTENTVSGWRGWRLRVEDVGVWMVSFSLPLSPFFLLPWKASKNDNHLLTNKIKQIHCHSLQHMMMGMQTIWVMGEAKEITSYPLPFESAASYETYQGASVEGTATHPKRGPSHPRRAVQQYAQDEKARREVTDSMEGYLSFGGAAYGNADRAPIVNHHFRT